MISRHSTRTCMQRRHHNRSPTCRSRQMGHEEPWCMGPVSLDSIQAAKVKKMVSHTHMPPHKTERSGRTLARYSINKRQARSITIGHRVRLTKAAQCSGHRAPAKGTGDRRFETLRRYNSRTLERVKKRVPTANSYYHEHVGRWYLQPSYEAAQLAD